ncbi:MAG: hypothetical protein K8H88_19255 [Sandaracinaceae bacterium]|nr:hypothetical protein [Sandaracinaceae bacterium]
MRSKRICWIATVLLACGGAGRVDAGALDAASRDARLDEAGSDGGLPGCPSGQHACGGGCIDDLLNDPANGCRFGCSEPCPAPPNGRAACSSVGTCTFACDPPTQPQGDRCVCAPTTCEALGYACGAPDNGCGTPLDCGACASGTCVMGQCRCPPDRFEPNDDYTVLTPLAELSDSAGTPADPLLYDLSAGIQGATDTDWYRFHVIDGTDGGSPKIDVTLTLGGVGAGSNYDLSAYYVCDNGGSNPGSCTAGTADNMIGHGCASTNAALVEEAVGIDTDCGGLFANASGTLYVRVYARTYVDSCADYSARVSVH